MVNDVAKQRERRRSRSSRRDVDALERSIDALVIERQAMRGRDATPHALERNRRRLAALEAQLSRASIDEHLVAPDHREAA